MNSEFFFLLIKKEDYGKILQEYKEKIIKVKEDKVKFLIPPDWNEKTFEGLWIKVKDKDIAEKIFRNYQVKVIKK